MNGFQVVRYDNPKTQVLAESPFLSKMIFRFSITPAMNNPFKNIEMKLNSGTIVGPVSSVRIIMMGDFNAKNTFWYDKRYNDPNGNTLRKFWDDNHDYILYFTENPTCYPSNNTSPSWLDLIMNKNEPDSIPELSSDHNPVVITVEDSIEEIVKKNIYENKQKNWTNNFRW